MRIQATLDDGKLTVRAYAHKDVDIEGEAHTVGVSEEVAVPSDVAAALTHVLSELAKSAEASASKALNRSVFKHTAATLERLAKQPRG